MFACLLEIILIIYSLKLTQSKMSVRTFKSLKVKNKLFTNCITITLTFQLSFTTVCNFREIFYLFILFFS